MSRFGGWAWRVAAAAAVIVDATGVALYLLVIDAQGNDSVTDREILGWAAVMALPGLLCLVASVLRPRRARWLLGAAVLPAAGMGLLAIFSVGLVFLAVAAIATAAAVVCLAVSQEPTAPSDRKLINSQA